MENPSLQRQRGVGGARSIVGRREFVVLKTSGVRLIRRSMGLSLHRPITSEYNVRALPQEVQRMKNSRLILLIVPQHSRGIAIMTLAAYLIGLRAKLVLCVQTMPEGCSVSGEKVYYHIIYYIVYIIYYSIIYNI